MNTEMMQFLTTLLGGALLLIAVMAIIDALSPNKPTTKGDWV